uniref:26S proteasome non-ATPase regulatory subunit 4 n=2 Tax=Hirondellea gigas TaxID=1518452 RepID=A0A2P2HY18_9CRUS
MGLESTIICVDNSEYMRNGDYQPTRLQAQQDAVNTICRFKLRSNPENNVGLITLSNNAEIVTTLTSDVGKILTSLHHVQPGGLMNLLTGLRIAHLALKHRGSRAHRMRVVAFVGSPLLSDEREVIRVAKKLKKESVVLDIVNFGETECNTKLLETLVNTVNGKDISTSHLVTIPAPCAHLAEALLTSPVMASEEGGTSAAQFASGGAFEFGVDPNEDPELALALRVSMEEQRQRQQEEERRNNGDSATAGQDAAAAATAPATDAAAAAGPAAAAAATTDAASTPSAAATPAPALAGGSEEEMLQQALAMSLEAGAAAATASAVPTPAAAAAPPPPAAAAVAVPDFATMSEEEQIAYAMQISMQDCEPMEVDKAVPASTTEGTSSSEEKKKEEAASSTTTTTLNPTDDDLTAVMADAAFLEGVLNKLPGVNPNSEVVKQAIDSYTAGASASGQDKNKDDDKKKKGGKPNEKKDSKDSS